MQEKPMNRQDLDGLGIVQLTTAVPLMAEIFEFYQSATMSRTEEQEIEGMCFGMGWTPWLEKHTPAFWNASAANSDANTGVEKTPMLRRESLRRLFQEPLYVADSAWPSAVETRRLNI